MSVLSTLKILQMEELEKSGLYIDDIYRLRVQDPHLANETNELREECLEYAEKLQEFHKLSNEFIDIMNKYGQMVEEQKLKAIALQIRLKSVHKRQQIEQQIYQVIACCNLNRYLLI